MTRVISGDARGRRLVVPPSGTRPTSDRAREAVFSALQSRLVSFRDLVVLDLYAGTGALGLEALSRGAKRVDFVESDPRAVVTIQSNIEAVALAGTHVHRLSAERWIKTRTGIPPAQLVFADPPYAMTNLDLAGVLSALAEGGLSVDCLVVVERPTRGPKFAFPPQITAEWDRPYGEATLWLGRFGSVTPC